MQVILKKKMGKQAEITMDLSTILISSGLYCAHITYSIVSIVFKFSCVRVVHFYAWRESIIRFFFDGTDTDFSNSVGVVLMQ